MIDKCNTLAAEQGFLSIAVRLGKQDERIRQALDSVDDNMFTSAHTQKVYEFIATDEKADFLSTSRQFMHSDPVVYHFVKELINSHVSVSSLNDCVNVMRQGAIQRGIINVCYKLAESAENGASADELMEDVTTQFAQLQNVSNYEAIHISEAAEKHIELLQDRAEGKASAVGVQTGIEGIDRQISGIADNWLVVLAGRPSHGKTLFAQIISENVSRHRPVLFFSLEMSQSEIVDRSLGINTSINPNDLRKGQYTELQYQELSNVMRDMKSKAIDLYIDTTPSLNVKQICSRAKQFNQKHNAGLIMIDYLGLMSKQSAERNDIAIGDITKRLKQLAKEIQTPILLLVQSNRQADKQQRMNMSNLADSASIERDADLVLFVHREEIADPDTKRQGITEISCGKFRHGTFGNDVWLTKSVNGYVSLDYDDIASIKRLEKPQKRYAKGFEI